MNAKLNFSFATMQDPARVNQEVRQNVAQAFVAPKTVLHDFAKAETPLNPLEEMERFLQSSGNFLPLHKDGIANNTERRLLDLNFFLLHNQSRDPEFAQAQPISFDGFADNALQAVWQLRKRYTPTLEQCSFHRNMVFLRRLRSVYFWLWYSVLGLNVDGVAEFQHWIDQMDNACCAVQLDNVSFCVRLLAGQWADDRDSYLAKLRPHFVKHSQRVQAKVITCDCNEGFAKEGMV